MMLERDSADQTVFSKLLPHSDGRTRCPLFADHSEREGL